MMHCMRAIRIAGVTAAINRPAIEVLPTAVQYRIIKTLGGMIGPSSEAEDMTAAEYAGE